MQTVTVVLKLAVHKRACTKHFFCCAVTKVSSRQGAVMSGLIRKARRET